MKLDFRKGIATAMAFVLAFCTVASHPAQVSAEDKNNGKYVSDVKLYQGSLQNAKKAEPDYTFVPQDLSEGSGSGESTYLGYKTTDDVSLAIRDIACLNMNGNYKIEDYNALLDEREQDLTDLVGGLQVAAKEFRENYEAQKPRALKAYDYLNRYYEDDTELNMGDFFLASEDQIGFEQYKTLYMEANSTTMHCLQRILLTAVDTSEEENTWFDRMSNLDGYEGLVKKEFGTSKSRSAEAHFTKLYGEDIEDYVDSWEELKEGLEDYLSTGVEYGTDEADDYVNELLDIEADGETSEDGMTATRYLTYGSIYKSLQDIPYGDGTLLDVFSKSLEENEIDQKTMFVFMDVLSEGQRELSSVVGLTELFLATAQQQVEETDEDSVLPMDEDMIEESRQMQEEQVDIVMDNVDEVIESVKEDSNLAEEILAEDAISVYAGVDRDFFHGKVGITSDGEKAQTSTGTPWYATEGAIVSSQISIAIGTSLIVMGIFTLSIRALLSVEAKHIIHDLQMQVQDLTMQLQEQLKEFTTVQKFNLLENGYCSETRSAIKRATEKLTNAKAQAPGLISKVVGSAMIVLGLALCAYSLIQNVKKAIYDEKHVEYLAIPEKMIDFSEGSGMDSPYLFYSVVRSHSGTPVDLNNFTSDNWLCLYTTRSYAAGDPILAKDFGTIHMGQIGSDVNEHYVHLFRTVTPQNLEEYSANGSKATPIYFGYRSSNVEETGSVFGKTGPATAAAALLAILAACAGVVYIARKKKDELAA